LGESLQRGLVNDTTLALARLWARDPDFEVRHAVVGILTKMPHALYFELSPALRQDCNAYVKRAAKRVSDRRTRAAVQRLQAERREDEVAAQWAAIGKQHGQKLARQVQRLCYRYNELVLGSIVHDLAGIASYLQTSFTQLAHQAGLRKPVTKGVRANLDMLARTIADVRDFMSPSPTARSHESLAQVVAEAVEMARDHARQCGFRSDLVAMDIDVPGWIVLPMARHLIVVALANVIKNAIEAYADQRGKMRPGRIEVRCRPLPDRVEIAIQDWGKGLCDAEMAVASRLIPGQRNPTKPCSTGYGLPIAVRNLTAHGGTLVIDSVEDQGATVTITLPNNRFEKE
jgi:signal transduction histidine kinase